MEEVIWSNFDVTLDPEFARNQKIVLINVDQDAILYLRVNYQHVLEKFPNPIDHPTKSTLQQYEARFF